MASFNNTDMQILRQYITAAGTGIASLAAGTVSIDVTHSNLLQRHIELRFDKHEKISELKHRIYRQTGTPPDYQKLVIKQGGAVVGHIGADDNLMIGYYGIETGMEVHCIDLNPYSASGGGAFEDVSRVKKFELTEEEYDKKKGTLREWAKKQKALDPTFSLERHAKEHQMLVEANRAFKASGGTVVMPGFELDDKGALRLIKGKEGAQDENAEPPGPETASHCVLGERCSAFPGDRRGVVMFVGEVEELAGPGGFWVGIKFDEPVGKTDGSVKGRVIFDAEGDKRGGFIRGKNVKCGPEFTEKDLMDEGDEDEGEEEEEEDEL